jgi:hypothetical protein
VSNHKIKPGSLQRTGGKIPLVVEAPLDDLVRFSFKYLDLHTNQKFSVDHCVDGYVLRFLERLKSVCGIPLQQFRSNRSPAIRSHPIDFADTTEPSGFKLANRQLQQAQPWQFEITANQHGRVHGILLDDTFFVIWIDPGHKLYA